MNSLPTSHDASRHQPFDASTSPRFKNFRNASLEAALETFAQSAGILTGDEVARRLRPHRPQPLSVLGRWIVERRVVNCSWRCSTLLPMFQFDAANVSLLDVVANVVEELRQVLDDAELLIWFAQANQWTHDRPPFELVQRDPDAVLRAARTDRFIVQGL